MRAVVYLKLATRQTKTPHIPQTKNYPEHNLKTVHKTHRILDLGTEEVVLGGGGERAGDPGLHSKDIQNHQKSAEVALAKVDYPG